MKPTLLILAAGMGSRYGGLKQLDQFGPNGEAIIEYSIFDAIRAGFGKVVFVIKEEFSADFKDIFLPKLTGKIEVAFANQRLDDLPEGYKVPEGRKKPWGTAHAVYAAREHIDSPFAVINADDYYGAESYRAIAGFLSAEPRNQQSGYAMVGYQLKNTLSEHGSVNRGLCRVDDNGYLLSIKEITGIEQSGTKISYSGEGGQQIALQPQDVVSMNLFGMPTDFFNACAHYFTEFLDENGDNLTAEFFMPSVLNTLIATNQIKLKVLESPSKWFGVTYQADKPIVSGKINDLVAQGVYPQKLWE